MLSLWVNVKVLEHFLSIIIIIITTRLNNTQQTKRLDSKYEIILLHISQPSFEGSSLLRPSCQSNHVFRVLLVDNSECDYESINNCQNTTRDVE